MADYDTIVVDPGETYNVTLGDGDTLENKLIDITAEGASHRFYVTGDGWTIKNVGIRGVYDDSVQSPIFLECPNGGSGTIDRLYIADGVSDTVAGADNATGIYVHPSHSGHIDILRCNTQDWNDNAIYASPPGNLPSHSTTGAGGTIAIIDCYSKNNYKSNFRLGTDGSYIENCVSIGGQRGFWGFYETTEVRDSNIDSGIYASDSAYQDDAVVNLINTNFEGPTHTYYSGAEINGTSQGTPQDFYPEGVPTSAEDAASGWSGDDGSDGGNGGGDVSPGVIEDHEDGGAASDFYHGATSYAQLATDHPLDGGYALEITEQWVDLGYAPDPNATPRGYEYRARLHPTSSTDSPWFIVSAQDTANAQVDGYFLSINLNEGYLMLGVRDGNTTAVSETVDVAMPVNTTYELAIELASETVTGVLYNATGTELARTATLTDTTYAGGTFGFYAGAESASVYYDTVERRALDEPTDGGGGSAPEGELSWSTEGDWQGNNAEQNVVYENIGPHSAGDLQLGYGGSNSGYRDPIAYFPFHDASEGATASDVVGSNDATYQNDVTAVNGLFGHNSAELDGTSSYITYPEVISHHDSDFSVAMWFQIYSYPSANGGAYILLKPQLDNGTDWFLMVDDDTDEVETITFNDFGYDDVVSGVSPDLNTWTFAGLTYDADAPEVRLYVDGVLEGSSSIGFSDRGATNWQTGWDADGYSSAAFMDGKVGSLLVWDVTLSDSEMQSVYDLTSGFVNTVWGSF